MKNILFNIQIKRLKYFIKTGQNIFYWPLSKDFNNSFLKCQRKSVGCINTRFLSTSVKYVDKSNENVNKGTEKENSIIYIGLLSYQVKGVKVFTCLSSIGGIFIQPWLLQNIINGNSLPLGTALFFCVGFFTFITPFLIHQLTKKYVTEIWYNSTTDTYTAIILSFFLKKININFKAEDVEVPFALPLFSTMYIKGKPLFIVSESFLEAEHYLKMTKFAKPLNLNSNDVANTPKEHKI